MKQNELDKIYIKDLSLSCIIGCNEEERKEKHRLIVNIVCWVSLSKPGKTDDIADTVDYKNLYLAIVKAVENSSYYLIEALAEHIAKLCLKDLRVKKVKVTVEKPQALKLTTGAGVEIVR